MKKVFIPDFVTEGWLPGHRKPKPIPTMGTWSGYPVKDADDNLDKPHFLPMVKEVYPNYFASYFEAAKDAEVSLPVLYKKYQKI